MLILSNSVRSKSLFTLISSQVSSLLMKNAKDLENLDKLSDSSIKSYSDSKSKRSCLEVNFTNRVVFLGHPVTFKIHYSYVKYLEEANLGKQVLIRKKSIKIIY